LSLFKHIGAKLALEPANSKPKRSSGLVDATNPERTSNEASHPLDRHENAEQIYELMLESCEKLFDNELEQSAFEDQMRSMFGVKVFGTASFQE
jgi:paired amphipathic helix protein Sin3a